MRTETRKARAVFRICFASPWPTGKARVSDGAAGRLVVAAVALRVTDMPAESPVAVFQRLKLPGAQWKRIATLQT